jgi:hypothetical protein
VDNLVLLFCLILLHQPGKLTETQIGQLLRVKGEISAADVKRLAAQHFLDEAVAARLFKHYRAPVPVKIAENEWSASWQ